MVEKFRVIIAGGRDFDDFRFLCKKCMAKLQNKADVTIVSGTANGADKLGEKFANFMGYEIKQFPANWDEFGKRAGYLRNKEMAEYADALIVFWDGKSKGTKHMIDLAKEKNLKVVVYYYKQEEEIDDNKPSYLQ
jgi:glycerophosphoryl diester phosphodiesterase